MAKTALIIIDMIKDFVHPAGKVFYPENRGIIQPIKRLLDTARREGLLRIFIADSHRENKMDLELELVRDHCREETGGDKVIKELNFDPKEEYLLKKRRYSAFFGTDLDLTLREHGIKNTILVGTKTNNCIRATVHDAYYLAYRVIVPRECVATNDQNSHQVHLKEIDKYFGGGVKALDRLIQEIKAGEL
ncbi:isochorismatase family cysteine hydrolase [Halocella sp. SP3-1]|uniref:cysteine hydrolase family protein n=1 Tax=Halocella sp. SP3-1 TaxID=2382161 RepID=UPI000F759A5A|nr:isochorismatase family cysteine hydrolase [Halocella sp. SP3-1]AZO93493.1 cysteine hydrolase [Halocella sp. SP3-1]